MKLELTPDDFETITQSFERIRVAIAETSTIPDRAPILALAADAQAELTEMYDNFRELLAICRQIPVVYDSNESIYLEISTLEQIVGAIGFHSMRANLALVYLAALSDPKLTIDSPMHPQNPSFYKVFALLKRILSNPILDREHRQLEKLIANNLANLDHINWSNI